MAKKQVKSEEKKLYDLVGQILCSMKVAKFVAVKKTLLLLDICFQEPI